MNEKDVLKQSVKVFIGGLIIFSIVGFVLKQISFPLGFILGYAVSVLSFYIIIVMSDVILKMGQAIRFVVMMFIAKMLSSRINLFTSHYGLFRRVLCLCWKKSSIGGSNCQTKRNCIGC